MRTEVLWLSYAITLISSVLSKDKNQILRDPSVRCGVDGVLFEMETMKPFKGQLYVKNEYKRAECRANFGGQAKNASGGVFRLHFNECGMRRQRMPMKWLEISPKGMAYTTTMVVQFHETFVTEADKAYQIRCFYREHNIGINADQMNISPLTTILMEVAHPVPQCVYSIRHKSMDGPPASFVTVGDPVVHLFKCDTVPQCVYSIRHKSMDGPPASFVTVGDPVVHFFKCDTDDDMYRMLIRDCYVDDGKENKQKIIDSEGCSLDVDIVETPEYTERQLVVFAEATVFKWPDEAAVYFSCQLTLCTTEDPECNIITPPECGSRRRRRSLANRTRGIFPIKGSEDSLDQETKDETKDENRLHFDLEVRRLVVLDIDPMDEEQGGVESRRLHFEAGKRKTSGKLTATTTTDAPTTITNPIFTTTLTHTPTLASYSHLSDKEPTTQRPQLSERPRKTPAARSGNGNESRLSASMRRRLRKQDPLLHNIPIGADLVIQHPKEPKTSTPTVPRPRPHHTTPLQPPKPTTAPLIEDEDLAEELNSYLDLAWQESLVDSALAARPPYQTPPMPTTEDPAVFARRVEEEVARRLAAQKPQVDIVPGIAELPWATTPAMLAYPPLSTRSRKNLEVVKPAHVFHKEKLSSDEKAFLSRRLLDAPLAPHICYSPQLVLGLGVLIGLLGVGLVVALALLVYPRLRSGRSLSYTTNRPPGASFAPYYAASSVSSRNSASCHS